MKIYQNPWVTRESYFVKTGTAKSAKMEAAKSSGYSIDFWNGKWVVRKTAYYNKSLSEMPVVCENKCSLQARIDKAIVDAVLGFVEAAKMDGGQAMIELKSCPFCGGKARLFVCNGVRVLCTKCGVTTRILVDSERIGTSAVEDVIKAWNGRKNGEV